MTTFDPDQVRQRIVEELAEAEREALIADALRSHADDHDFFARKAQDRAAHLTDMLAKETTP